MPTDPATPPAADSPAPGETPSPVSSTLEEFLLKYEPQPKSMDDALSTPATQVQDIAARATAELHEMVDLEIDADTQQQMAGKRYPEMTSISYMLADALAGAPEVARAVDISPQQVLDVVYQDEAASMIALSGHHIAEGAQDGQILAGAVLDNVCRSVLTRAEVALTNPQIAASRRNDLQLLFFEPMRALSEMDAAPSAQAAQDQRDGAGAMSARDAAAREAAELRLMESFQAALRRG